MNSHDVDAMVALAHEDYRSEQPVHPGRAFVGSAQMRANWEALFTGIPDFRAVLLRSVTDEDTVWCEWSWSGTRTDRQPFDSRGVTLFQIRDGRIVAGSLYMEDLERENVGIEQTVQNLSGIRPKPVGLSH